MPEAAISSTKVKDDCHRWTIAQQSPLLWLLLHGFKCRATNAALSVDDATIVCA